ncbi:unnamed protein product [Owenia fusiformis]|uniref:Uncharacterized protein n=1 Tax=Owenia fusiformis TaxID=6347 RepID=A0A8J1UEU5_OWEFU|nr:unnamed protein product [Owenia fusiformis]
MASQQMLYKPEGALSPSDDALLDEPMDTDKGPSTSSNACETGSKTKDRSKSGDIGSKKSRKLSSKQDFSDNSLQSLTQAITTSISSGLGAIQSTLSGVMTSSIKDLQKCIQHSQYAEDEDDFGYNDEEDEIDEDQFNDDTDGCEPPPRKKPKVSDQEEQTDEPARKASSLMQSLQAKVKTHEEMGPPLSDGAAALLNDLIQSNMNDDDEKLKFDKYKTPSNTPNVSTTKVNEQIWSRVSADVRSSDIRLQKTQAPLIKATIASMRALEMIDELKQNLASVSDDYDDTLGKIAELMYDSIELSCSANYKFNLRRRELSNLKSVKTLSISARSQSLLLLTCLATTSRNKFVILPR